MKTRIAISTLDNKGLGGLVSEHFGRCAYFTIAEIEENRIKSIKVIDNPYANSHAPGQIPEFIHRQGANVMLAGGMGHRAVTFFEQYGIEAVTGAAGTVLQAVQAYLDGQLNGASPCAESQHHHDYGEALHP
jgi:predicted Fe-Mo cluster-binding NifX family protein